jgi:hypothetical protein
VIFVGAISCALEAVAFAEAPEPTRGARENTLPSVTLAVVGDPGDAAAVDARVVSWFHEQGTPTRSSRQPAVDAGAVFSPTGEPGVRIWILLKLPALVRVFFAVEEPANRPLRYLVRDVALDGGLDELGLEQVAQVVNLSALALWAGNLESSRQEVETGLGVVAPLESSPVGTAGPSTPSAPSAPSKDPGADWRARVTVGVEYAARLAGPEGLVHGPGANMGVLFRHRPFEIGPRFHAQLILPREVTHSGVALELHGAALGLGLAAARQTAERVWATGEVGTGLDLVEYEATSFGDASLRASATRPELRPLAYASLGVRADLGAVSITGAVLLAVQFLHTHYDISDRSERSELFGPWVVQPGLTTSVIW